MNSDPRKLSQEAELDQLLAEEFACEPEFVKGVVKHLGLDLPPVTVTSVIPQPLLSSGGYGDLLIKGETQNETIAFLVENKITAAPATRQAIRYQEHKHKLLADGVSRVITILVAPQDYTGEADQYDAFLSLETVLTLLLNDNPLRLDYRKRIIRRTLAKKSTSGVKLHSPNTHELRKRTLQTAKDWCQGHGLELTFPPLKERVYDGDSWITPITCPSFPKGVELRYRLWTTLKTPCGQVDLIFRAPTPEDAQRLKDRPPSNASVDPFSKFGLQVSVKIPEMRPDQIYAPETVVTACSTMAALVSYWEQNFS